MENTVAILHECVWFRQGEHPKQVQALTLCFSRDTLTTLGLSDEEKSSTIAVIQSYIDGHINETVEH